MLHSPKAVLQSNALTHASTPTPMHFQTSEKLGKVSGMGRMEFSSVRGGNSCSLKLPEEKQKKSQTF